MGPRSAAVHSMVLLAVLMVSSNSAGAQAQPTFDRLVVFGDSLSDIWECGAFLEWSGLGRAARRNAEAALERQRTWWPEFCRGWGSDRGRAAELTCASR